MFIYIVWYDIKISILYTSFSYWEKYVKRKLGFKYEKHVKHVKIKLAHIITGESPNSYYVILIIVNLSMVCYLIVFNWIIIIIKLYWNFLIGFKYDFD